VHHWRNPRVPLRSSCRELRPDAFNSSIRPLVHHRSTIFFSAPANFVFSSELYSLFSKSFLCFSPHVATQPISLSPSPCVPFHPHHALPSSGRRGSAGRRLCGPARPWPTAEPPLVRVAPLLPAHGDCRRGGWRRMRFFKITPGIFENRVQKICLF
jgi:hypothetical protein